MLTSERIEEIQSRSRADYACLDAPGFRDSLAARRDVAALLSDRAELQAEIYRLRAVVEAAEYDEFDECRICHSYDDEPHDKKCPFAALEAPHADE